MGWWKTSEGDFGDGAIDSAGDLLDQIRSGYLRDRGRNPTLKEVLETIRLALAARLDEFGADGSELLELRPKIKKSKKIRSCEPGDIVAIPLEDGTKAFALLTPQRWFLEFYELRRRSTPRLAEFAAAARFRLPFCSDPDAIASGRWRIVAHRLMDQSEFEPQQFLIGDKVAIGRKEYGKFFGTTATLRPATLQESRVLPKYAIYGYLAVERELRDKLAKLPVR